MMADKGFSKQREIRRTGERGAALIIALLAITVITGVGFALILSSSTEALIHGNFRGAGLVLMAARGGVEEARGRLGPDAAPAVKICGLEAPADCTCTGGGCGGAPPLLSTINKAVYIRNGAIDPGNPACSFRGVPGDCWDANAPASAGDRIPLLTGQNTTPSSPTPSYAWVKITLATQEKLNRNMTVPGAPPPLEAVDPRRICWNWRNLILAPPTNPTCNIDGVPSLSPAFILTALAIEPGGARRVVREVDSWGTLPPIPGPLTLDGPNAVYPPPTSNRYQVSAIDAGTPPDTTAPAIGVVTDADDAAVTASICSLPSSRWDDYPGHGTAPGPDPSDCPAGMKGDPTEGPSVENVSTTMDPQYQTCDGLNAIVSQITAAADAVYTGPVSRLEDASGNHTFGGPGNPMVNVVIGDANLNASDFPARPNAGLGILLVTGNLNISGYPDYDGIIFVIGTGSFSLSGGGNGTINGGVFIANTNDTPCPGTPTFSTSGGGNFNIQYNSDLTRLFNGYLPLRRISLNY